MPLYKSFSEQSAAPGRRRPQWQRSKSGPAPQTTVPPRPLPVSEKTKNKLLAYQFELPAPRTDAEDTNSKHTAPPQPAKVGSAVTPASRSTWQDLLGKPGAPTEDENQSPNERVLWRNDHDANQPVAMSPLLSRKGRKRARSSSPVSSPASKHTTPAVDVKKLAEVLRTPNADPALELWDRFSVPGSCTSPSGLTNPLLAQLMVSSSPRPKEGGGSGSARPLRKAISCGSHWPKRRKLERTESEAADPVAGKSQPDSKLSMVSALLETVTEGIRKSKSAQPKSPSPRPRPQGQRNSPLGPGPVRRSPSPRQSGSSPLAKKSTRLEPEGDVAKVPLADKAFSDYGDDDFDDDKLLELDASILEQRDDPTLVVSSEGPDQQALTLGDHRKLSPAAPKPVDDEFGDLDDDFFDGAEDLVAEVEARHMSQKNTQDPSQGQRHDRSAKACGGKGYDDDDDDAYGDDFDDDIDFDAVERAAAQAASCPSPSNPSQKPRAIQRYLITNVLDSSYTDERGREQPEKILLVEAERTKTTRMVHLRGDWYDTQASTKAYVHIIGEFEPSGRCVIDNNHNTLILHPDQLVSSTVVADSFTCMRRAVLQDRVKATSEATPALVYGNILHEVFQEALMANSWDLGFLGSVINKILPKHLEDLYVIKVSLEDARSHLLSKMTELRSWAEAFVAANPKPNAFVQGKNGERVNMCVSKLLDVEEHVWSPMYGLKGNIDATVQVTMRDGKASKTLTVPFEVKTGKNATANHQAQTVLYNLLLSDRYDIEIAYGILYYMETSQTLRIPAIRHELRHMIMQRNVLACYIRERSVQLPPMKRSKNACGKCYAQASCFTYHRLADDGNGETSGLNEKFDELVKHLTPTHKEFFLKWEDLLTKEEKESQKLRRELWTMVSTEREKLGRCFANVIIQEGSAHEDKHQAKINRFSYTFVKENPAPGFSFVDSQLTVGEPIVVSDEQGHFALALGYVTAVRKQQISVAVDRRLHNARIRQPGFDAVDNQVFASIMEVAPEGAKPEQSQGKIKEAPIRYRLDKDEFSNGMATVRSNLVQTMADGPFGSAEIRRLVVDLVPPRFKTTPTQYTIAGKDSLNVDQKAAVEKALRFAELHIPDMDALRARHFSATSFLSSQQQQRQRQQSGPGSSHSLSPSRQASFCPSPRRSACWLADLLAPEARVRFVNTDGLLPHAREQAKGNRIVNPCEARVVAQLVDALLAVGVPAREVGVVTHYRSQLALLRHSLLRKGDRDGGVVEMHTADRFQGRDKAVVILSLVRNNENCAIGELLKDWRRINVAFTRAKTKLLVVGSRATLGGCGEGEMLARFVRLMEERDWVYDLPPGALDAHFWEDAAVASGAVVVGTQGSVGVVGGAVAGAAALPAVDPAGKGVDRTTKGARKAAAAAAAAAAATTEAASGVIGGEENRPAGQKQPKKAARIGERAMLKGKPVLRDILNDMMDGGY
ncbi:DNA replication factor Dna2-domain-containing protein [Chaetomium strumarium]|uniref:DNA replication ATP-dependent helicase/nuclease DNA2 n=1 Tax=Chaetomium strumarium TaxID=1170767 RepID=A0AAJ0GNL5_9PEZI|nr:DNA replication factor Dna2-domain-containing protein [Chaetomium strumarium]